MKNTNALAEEWSVKIVEVMMMVMSYKSKKKKKNCYVVSVQAYVFV